MKKIKKSILLVSVLCFMSFAPQIADLIKLAVESNHSTLQFSIPISNGITRVTGKFTDYSVDIDYLDNNLTKSNISVVIKAESINTGIPDRDNHLRTKDFFEVETYPEITFISDSITKNSDDFTVHGNFTMHGITKQLNFPIKMTGQDGKYTFGFTSRLTINRIDYGVGENFKHSAIENFLGENIDVEIDFWTKKRK